MNVEAIISIATATVGLLSTKKCRRFLFGTYSDGTVRSLTDALNDEYRSPEDRDRRTRLDKAKKKKAKKNKRK